MVNVVISGLPKNLKLHKFLAFLKQTFFGGYLTTKLTNTTFMHDATKTITLSMRSNDARKARRSLDGHAFKYGMMEYPLQCWTEDETGKEYSHDLPPREEGYSDYDEPQRKPMVLQEELEEVELKIELVKKQRMLLEEENKMRLEMKKAEMLENIGPNDFHKLANYEKACGGQNFTPKAKKNSNNKFPDFRGSCFKIIAEMQALIEEHVNDSNKATIRALLNSAIKKRLMTILKGKPIMSTLDILHLYRVSYPQNTDKKLIDESIEKFSESSRLNKDKTNNTSNDNIHETENQSTDIEQKIHEEPEMNKVSIGPIKNEFGPIENEGGPNENEVGSYKNEVCLNKNEIDFTEDGDDMNQFVNMDNNDFDEWVEDSKGNEEDV